MRPPCSDLLAHCSEHRSISRHRAYACGLDTRKGCPKTTNGILHTLTSLPRLSAVMFLLSLIVYKKCSVLRYPKLICKALNVTNIVRRLRLSGRLRAELIIHDTIFHFIHFNSRPAVLPIPVTCLTQNQIPTRRSNILSVYAHNQESGTSACTESKVVECIGRGSVRDLVSCANLLEPRIPF